MKRLLTLIMLAIYGLALVGCSHDDMDTDDMDHGHTTVKKTTVSGDDGVQTKTEVKSHTYSD